ncbi:MAG: hypothetical protein A3H33_16955 [Betaproteobacteria bacterium RIFCSPLOWO2_02_FULL_65_20]|nr:MAG: hypothetical protein A3H33_16955 [Betaproteobacteria bacterium RIFCSPLOWO2_02_FULL_65_20]
MVPREQQPPVRRRIVSGQRRQFALEPLETQIDLEPVGVLAEQFPRALDVLARNRLMNRFVAQIHH